MIYKLSNEIDIAKLFDTIGVDKVGSTIMVKKAKLNLFCLKNISTKAANILKQDALSIGAELATSRHTADFSRETTDAILICNDKQLEILAKKEQIQPFGLKRIARELANHTRKTEFEKQIMGVLNINFDSFFVKSRVGEGEFVDRALKMIVDGAKILDIGGVSSRPGSVYPGESAEIERLEPIFKLIAKHKLYEKTKFSIDTFSPKVAKLAFDSGFSVLNDITGLENDALAQCAGEYGVDVVIMHKNGDTETMQNEPKYDDVVLDIDEFFTDRSQKANSYGIKNIILDVGIGFGKTLEHNLSLLKNLSHFTHFGYPLLFGASRKKIIDDIITSHVDNRLAGTLSLHQKALDNGASIIRAHDVSEHVQMLKIWEKVHNYV